MLRRSILLLIGVVLGSVLTTGCEKGPPPGAPMATPYRVTGQIKFRNGTPLRGGIIYFTPLEIKSWGKVRYEGAGLVDRQGRYQIGFGGDNAGVPAGEYKVTIQPRDYQEIANSNSASIPKQYRDRADTPLMVTVEENDNTFDIVLR